MLTRNGILHNIDNRNIVIEPYDEKYLGPNSYDVHLHDKLLVYEDDVLDIRRPNRTKEIIIPEEGYVLQPGILYLGSTKEYTETRNLIPNIDGVSSNARLGISIHVTAGFGDVGFKGNWTLEITVIHPVRVYPGCRIGQLYYDTPIGDCDTEYNGKYQGSREVMASKSFLDK